MACWRQVVAKSVIATSASNIRHMILGWLIGRNGQFQSDYRYERYPIRGRCGPCWFEENPTKIVSKISVRHSCHVCGQTFYPPSGSGVVDGICPSCVSKQLLEALSGDTDPSERIVTALCAPVPIEAILKRLGPR